MTRELATLHVGANDVLLAHAESALLQEPAAGRHLFSVATGTAIYEAMAEESRDWESYQAAKRDGVDEPTLRARFGDVPPLHVDPVHDWVGHLADPSRVLERNDRRLRSESGIVRAVAESPKKGPHGERLVQVSFNDILSNEDISSCYETGKIASVTFDSSRHARLHYETVCNTVGTKTNVERVLPVLIPTDESSRLEPGEMLLTLVDQESRVGVVVKSYAKDKPVKAAKCERASRSKAKSTVLQVRGERIGSK